MAWLVSGCIVTRGRVFTTIVNIYSHVLLKTKGWPAASGKFYLSLSHAVGTEVHVAFGAANSPSESFINGIYQKRISTPHLVHRHLRTQKARWDFLIRCLASWNSTSEGAYDSSRLRPFATIDCNTSLESSHYVVGKLCKLLASHTYCRF